MDRRDHSAGGRRIAAATLVAPVCAALAAAIALGALVLRSIEAGPQPSAGPVMVPATSAALLLAAGALLLLRGSRPGRAPIPGFVLAGATTLLGLFGFGVDSWALRPSTTTGLGLTLAGASLLALGLRSWRWAGLAGAATLVIALSALIGHAYGAGGLYGLNPLGGTAISTGFALGAIATGVLFADPSRGLAAVSLSDSAGGQLLRRLIPTAVFGPLVLGWLAITAVEAGIVSEQFAAALVMASLIVLLVGLIVRQAALVHSVEKEREALLERERETNEQVSGILESITDAFFAIDRDWRFTYVNREAESLLQRSREELIGRELWQEFSAALGTTFEREYERAMSEQTTVRFEAYYPPPLDAWYDVRAYPTADGLSVYFSNITERKQAQERLRESEERYRLLADMIPQHIWTTNPDGYHTYFSRRWYEFTGMTLEASQGEGWLDRVHPDDQARTVARWQHSLSTGERYSIEYRFRGANGEYRWFFGQAEPERNEAGEIVRWFGTLTDISELKRLQEEREQLLEREREARAEADRRREQLERVTESRTRLMRGFSHDVKNPLGAADGYAQLLEEGVLGELSERQRDSIGRIRRSIDTSLKLIGDLLELARAESGQLDIDRVDTDVTQAARDVAEDFRAQASARGLEIVVEGPDGLSASSDPTRLRQILANLLSNAVKYAPNGRATVRADIAQRHGADAAPSACVAVSVTDTGPGIPAEKRELIFQEFTRLDPDAQAGAGVGLAISRRIAQLMGGDLTVESEVGRGSTFTLWLPPAGGVPGGGGASSS